MMGRDGGAGATRNAQRLGDITEREAKRLRLRRFTYYRNRHARLDDPRLRLAGQLASAPLYLVEAFVQRLDAFASANTPRGSIEGFSIEATALHWGVREEMLARLYVALEDAKIGWLANDFVVDFWAENPDTDDPTANERQDRSRKLRAALTRIAALAREGRIDLAERTRLELAVHAIRDRAREHAIGWAEWKTELRALLSPASLSQRDSVTVTPRSDQSPRSSEAAVDNRSVRTAGEAQGLSSKVATEGAEGALDDQQKAELWLATEGTRIVTEQMQNNRQLAATKVARWRDQDLAGDAAALVAIIRGAERTGAFGLRFLNLIVDGLREAKRRGAAQRELPIPPVPVGERKLG